MVRKLCVAIRAALSSVRKLCMAIRAGVGTFQLLPPPLRRSRFRLGGFEDDARSLSQDWRMVGQDIRKAMRHFDDPGD